jgi:PKD repeat protein
MNASSFTPTWLGLTSNCSPYSSCTAGETIHFTCYAPLVQGGYDQNCATHTYTWTFPDSTTATTNDPVIDRVVSSGGTVKVNVNNGTANLTYTISQPLTFGSGGGGGGNTCDTMGSGNMFLGVTAASCPNGGTCSTGDSITFEVQPYLYNLNCASHSFFWSFGDGATANTQKAFHTYSANGAHSVTMSVSNAWQTYSKTVTVTTAPGSGNGGGNCATMTTSNVAIAFSAPSGCSSNNTATPCKNGETINFDVTSYTNYDFSCSNQFTFSWNFGDGSAAVTGKSPTHTFAASGNHSVVVTISNPSQLNFPRTLTMSTSDSSSCGTIVPNLTLSITYANAAGTCNQLGGDCAAQEVVNFSILPYQYDLGCAVHTFDWDFGDGSAHVTTKDAPHQYLAQGNYNVKCKVSNGGAPVTLTQQVSVKAGPPASTPVLVTYSVAPLTNVPNGFLFTPSFDHPELVAKWQWDFGDGQKSSMISGTARPISWIYADNKPYTVTLTAYDSSGQPVGTATHPVEPKRRSVRH